MKVRAPWSKIVENFKTVAAEHQNQSIKLCDGTCHAPVKPAMLPWLGEAGCRQG